MMSDGVRLIHRPQSGTATEQACAARARAWDFVFRCWQEKQKTAEPAPERSGQDDVKESNGYVATDKYTR
jgi:hypothetical protein